MKMRCSSKIGEKLPMFVCGLCYDDDGFAIIAICDTMENALEIKEAVSKKFSPNIAKDIEIKKFNLNQIYDF